MQIVISALHFEWKDLAECLGRVTDEFHVDGIELSWGPSREHPRYIQEDLDLLTKAHAEGGLALSAHIWQDLAQLSCQEGSTILRHWLGLCDRTGTTDLIVHGGTSPNQREGIAHVRSVFEAVLPEFERAGVAINLENHYAYSYHDCNELFSEPWEFLEVFSLDSPSLRFCFDTGHGHMTRNSEELIGELAPWLHYVHLADNQGIDDDHAMFREGTVAWDGVFTRLRDAGFDGTFCVEFPVREALAPFHRCLEEIRARWPETKPSPATTPTTP